MAKFEVAFGITMKNEGGYVFDPNDKGGETFAGISRKYNPNWKGWPIIDSIKATYGKTAAIINQHAFADTNLVNLKNSFYKANYWDTVALDGLLDQQVGNNCFDCSVNPCIDSVGRVMQKAVNKVHPNSIVVDGKIGPKSISAINSCDPELLFNAINEIRQGNYSTRVQQDTSQLKYLKSWLSRLVSYKHQNLA